MLEPVLFRIYGRENIVKQRPYERYLIDHYWVVSGTLPEDWVGGTFMIIMDARNSQVIRLTHGR
ncbi:NTF2 fold immunity protein [Hymenobacter negativus]|uniref:NTF2 fold immunity protein n=1 Tax=Hymenobacter negativus TaxID=2795026 RepID=UPI003979338D